jgi:hypothetical protein
MTSAMIRLVLVVIGVFLRYVSDADAACESHSERPLHTSSKDKTEIAGKVLISVTG